MLVFFSVFQHFLSRGTPGTLITIGGTLITFGIIIYIKNSTTYKCRFYRVPFGSTDPGLKNTGVHFKEEHGTCIRVS